MAFSEMLHPILKLPSFVLRNQKEDREKPRNLVKILKAGLMRSALHLRGI